MASGSSGAGRKQRMATYRKTKASKRKPIKVPSREEMGTPF